MHGRNELEKARDQLCLIIWCSQAERKDENDKLTVRGDQNVCLCAMDAPGMRNFTPIAGRNGESEDFRDSGMFCPNCGPDSKAAYDESEVVSRDDSQRINFFCFQLDLLDSRLRSTTGSNL